MVVCFEVTNQKNSPQAKLITNLYPYQPEYLFSCKKFYDIMKSWVGTRNFSLFRLFLFVCFCLFVCLFVCLFFAPSHLTQEDFESVLKDIGRPS